MDSAHFLKPSDNEIICVKFAKPYANKLPANQLILPKGKRNTTRFPTPICRATRQPPVRAERRNDPISDQNRKSSAPFGEKSPSPVKAKSRTAASS